MNRRRIRIILLIAISASLGGVTFKVAESIWLVTSKTITKGTLKALDYVPQAALQIKEFHRAQVNEGGRKAWEIFGDEAHYLKDQRQLAIQKPRIFLYQKDNNAVEAVAQEGYLWFTDEDRELEKAQLKGEAQVTFRGYVLNTHEIFYFKTKNQMVLPGRVTVKGNGMELEGVNMEVSIDDDKMRLLKNVTTKIEPDKLRKAK